MIKLTNDTLKQTYTNTKIDVNVKQILVVGFNDFSYILLNEDNDDFGYYRFKEMSDSFKAYHWLETQINNKISNEPIAVICNYDFLKDDNYNLLKNIQLHAELRSIPFLVVATEEAFDLNPEVALKMGIDDCYTEPVNWNSLRQRLEFLYEFKPQMTNAKIEELDQFSDRIPLGKRIFDVTSASIAILLLSPLMFFIAICIKLSSSGQVLSLIHI